MKTHQIFTRPTKTSEIYDDFYYEISHDWQQKAKRLQARRRRAIKEMSRHERLDYRGA